MEATPAILRGLISEISEDDARWKTAGDRLSIAEVLFHLSHSESHCYRRRVDRFLSEEMPELERFLPDAKDFDAPLAEQAHDQRDALARRLDQ